MSCDVVVVGGGAAGLNAALPLARSGQRVVLLEARKRVGGRIFTHHESSPIGASKMSIELGAEFVHGLPEATWSLIREASLETYELSGTPFWYSGNRLISGNEQMADAQSLMADMADKALQPSFKDVSFADYLKGTNVDSISAQAAKNYVEGFN